MDEWPDAQAKERAFQVFRELDRLDGLTIGAEVDKYGGPPFLRFSHDAQELFDEWRNDLENLKLRAIDEDPLIICHLAKYRSLMPKLALLFHLIEVAGGTATGPVSRDAAEMAAGWCDVLECHARRIYGRFGDPIAKAARSLAERIKKREVRSSFRIHQVAQRGWTDLGTSADVEMAVERLEALNWVRREKSPSSPQGGRPKTVVHVNPRLLGEAA